LGLIQKKKKGRTSSHFLGNENEEALRKKRFADWNNRYVSKGLRVDTLKRDS